jgi:hypothetical protein
MGQIASHLPPDKPHLSFVNSTASAAIATLDKVFSVGTYLPSVTYGTDGLSQAFKAVAGAMVAWPRHEGVLGDGGRLRHACHAEHERTQRGLCEPDGHDQHGHHDVLHGPPQPGPARRHDHPAVLGVRRRISENGSQGTDHGAAGTMLAIGSNINGGLYGTAPDLNPFPGNPTLENNGGDVTFGVDFRSVYARVIDNWLGGNSVSILNGDFERADLSFV